MTIRESLEKIKEVLEYFHALEDDPESADDIEHVKALKAISEIESAINAPMKSAEEWIKDFSDNVLGFMNGGGDKSIEIIRAIQQDALLHAPRINLDVTPDEIRLHCGEISPEEMRTVMAVIGWLKTRVNQKSAIERAQGGRE